MVHKDGTESNRQRPDSNEWWKLTKPKQRPQPEIMAEEKATQSKMTSPAETGPAHPEIDSLYSERGNRESQCNYSPLGQYKASVLFIVTIRAIVAYSCCYQMRAAEVVSKQVMLI